jgi:hypothetical protein
MAANLVLCAIGSHNAGQIRHGGTRCMISLGCLDTGAVTNAYAYVTGVKPRSNGDKLPRPMRSGWRAEHFGTGVGLS